MITKKEESFVNIKEQNSSVSKKILKQDNMSKEMKKIEKVKKKESSGKNLSGKEREKLRLLRSKFHYKPNIKNSLIIKNVKKSFGSKKILRGVTFSIEKGERLSLIGKNGSGKSTLINVISQQLKMSEGEITYGYAKNRLESLELMGIQFQSLNYPEGFIVKDVIHFFNVSVEKSIRMSKRELLDIVAMFGIDKFINQKIDRLSGGQQQRINILLALIKKPKLLILDEISTGLDVESAEIIKEYINEYFTKFPETSLLLISHSDEEIRELTTRVVVLEAGKIVEEFNSNKLTNKKFLEITSREAKKTKKEIFQDLENSKKLISKLERRYNIKEKGTFGKVSAILNADFAKKFQNIDNSNMSEGNIIEIIDVSKTYGKTVGAVRNMSLEIKDGERISITGPNGSGKSTIAEIIAQVRTPDNKNKKFTNKRHLAKADYKRILSNIEEDINIKLRKFKNKYRLDRELSEREAKNILENKNKEIKIAKLAATKASSKEKTQEAKIHIADIAKRKRGTIDREIENILSKAKIKSDKAKEEFIKLEKKLLMDSEIKKVESKKDYELNLKMINIEEKIFKNEGLIITNKYSYNGTVVKSKKISEPKSKISYSFTNCPRGVKNESGVQFQYASFPVEMSVLDVILFFARTNEKAMSKKDMISAVRIFKLDSLLTDKASRLSGGERQRLNVLLAIMKSPKLLILDEISTGLDVDSILKIDAFIQDYLNKTNATLILISHNYHEVHSLVDKIVVMKYGKLSEIVDTKGWKLLQTKAKMKEIYKGGGF